MTASANSLGERQVRELELTVARMISIWWLMLWRGAVGGLLVGAIFGAIGGVVMAASGHSDLAGEGGRVAGITVGPFWGFLVVYMGLRKNYKGFRIALVAR